MSHLPLAYMGIGVLWYALPLIVVVSLVYSATRYEQMGPILRHALRTGGWMVVFLLAALLLMQILF